MIFLCFIELKVPKYHVVGENTTGLSDVSLFVSNIPIVVIGTYLYLYAGRHSPGAG